MREIHALGQQYGFRIIEDASHAVGATYLGEPVGNCRYSDITIFSFHLVKIITTAEGGMAMTNDPALAERMERLRSHGIHSATRPRWRGTARARGITSRSSSAITTASPTCRRPSAACSWRASTTTWPAVTPSPPATTKPSPACC